MRMKESPEDCSDPSPIHPGWEGERGIFLKHPGAFAVPLSVASTRTEPRTEMMKKFAAGLSMLVAILIAVESGVPSSAAQSSFLRHYKGTPYHDSRYQSGPQAIPGTVLCAYYDLGGEGVAYHDSDAKNNGSGTLN